jgi:hypothetical protein
VREIDQLKGWSKQQRQAAPAQFDRATVGSQPQQLYEQVLEMVQDSKSSKGDGVSPLTCDDLCLLASRLPVLMQLLGRKSSVLPAASALARRAADSLQQGDLPTTPRFWSELLYGLTKAGLVVDTEVNASQTKRQQANIHLQQLLDAGVTHLPSLLASKGAAAQDVSMTLLAYAYAGYAGDLGAVVQAVGNNLDRCLQRPVPQGIANALWALGKLCDMGSTTQRQPGLQSSAYSQLVFKHALQQLTRFLNAGEFKPQPTPQEISNTVYACALAGHMEGLLQFLASVCQHPDVMDRVAPQDWSNLVWGVAVLCEAATDGADKRMAGNLLQYGQLLLAKCVQTPGVMDDATPQAWSNTVWAAARLGCVEEGAQLLRKLTSNLDAMRGAKPQEWSNTLWAAGTLRLYNQDLFRRAMQQLSAMPSSTINEQDISNTLWACAICAHWDSGVQQLLGRVAESDLAQFTPQELANTAWAWAVLANLAQEGGSYEQHEQCFQQVAALLFKEAASRPVDSFSVEGRKQLNQAHLFAGYLGMSGLPDGQVLEAARQAGMTTETTASPWQKEVHSALRQMGYTTQLEGLSADGLMRADIAITALPDGSPCSIAVECDGPSHYVTEHTASTAPADRLDGPTCLRNALLSRSFPAGLVCIYWRDWETVKRDRPAQEEYLSRALAKVVRDKVGALVERNSVPERISIVQ